jgi:hypothetical protein
VSYTTSRSKTSWLARWLGAFLLVAASARAADFVVHEWGTFRTHHGP